MVKNISPDEVGSELSGAILEYIQAINGDIEGIIDQVSEAAVKEIRVTGGYQDNPTRSKKSKRNYRRSFYRKKDTGKSKWVVSAVIGNRKWSLTHLLEYGHALRNGGRARAFPHFDPVGEKYSQTYLMLVKFIFR